MVQSRALHAQIQRKNEDGVQHDIHHRPQGHGEHAHHGKALGVDEGIHPKPDHHKQGPQQVNGQIVVGVGKGHAAGPEQIQDGTPEHEAEHGQPRAEQQQQHKGVAHDALGLFVLPPPPVDGAQGRAAHTAQVGKAHQNGNDGQAQPQAGQGQMARQTAQVHPVHDIIKNIDELRHRHGHSHTQNIAGHAPLEKSLASAATLGPPLLLLQKIGFNIIL